MLAFATKFRFLTAIGFLALPVTVGHAATPALDFDKDIRPILSENCYACHGPDQKKRKADLRLDTKEGLFSTPDDKPTIVPGASAKSEIYLRLTNPDEKDRMPPAKFGKRPTDQQVALIKQWIDQGAVYRGHWAYIPPERPATPTVKNSAWAANPIDRFILARLEKDNLAPNPEADRYTLIRRLSLDLTGLPPTIAEADAFVNDKSPNAYEKAVDHFLASPHYGEKMALGWLDLARFGDTNGYHHDSTRQMWLWRDYVINSFNKNKPFDQFSIEQLAGDMLPNATVEQKIASGFNRNVRFNEEGGADPNEFVVQYAMDRANTLGTIWLGLTVGCAQCHSHKYDPISQKEYYQLYAFFNTIEDPMVSMNHDKPLPPLLTVAAPEQEKTLADAKTQLGAVEQQIAQQLATVTYTDPGATPTTQPKAQTHADYIWLDDDAPAGATLANTSGDAGWVWVTEPVHTGKRAMKRSGPGTHQHYFTGSPQTLHVGLGDHLFAYVYLDPKSPPKSIMLQYNTGQDRAGDQWEHRAFWGDDTIEYGKGKNAAAHHRIGDLPAPGQWARLEVNPADLGLPPNTIIHGMAFSQNEGVAYWDTAGINTATPQQPDENYKRSQIVWERRVKSDPAQLKDNRGEAFLKDLREALAAEPAKRTEKQAATVHNYYLAYVHPETAAKLAPLRQKIDQLISLIKKTEESMPTTMVSQEMAQPRKAFLLIRGNFETPGEEVHPEVPAILPPMSDHPHNRLGLAQWVVDKKQPLTARVTVNRFWKQMFGTGIINTPGDFGSQGERPSHAELLDWLAVDFMDAGWDVKHVLKTIAMSATYRQSARVRPDIEQIDHADRLLWHSPRYRLTAEEIRDNALSIAGLLSPKIGGPSVFPYQPAGFYNGKFEVWKWTDSKGEDEYRRGMYTFWRRTSLHPTYGVFDAPSREVCIADRARTNTPLQALTMLNEPSYVEAARVFGQRILQQGGQTLDSRITFAFRTALVRPPTEAETSVVTETYNQQLDIFKKDAAAAKALVSAGDSPRPADLDVPELAAWTAVANVILSLDETITRE